MRRFLKPLGQLIEEYGRACAKLEWMKEVASDDEDIERAKMQHEQAKAAVNERLAHMHLEVIH